MLILPPKDIVASEITPQAVYENRRHFLKLAGFGIAGAVLPAWSAQAAVQRQALNAASKTDFAQGEKLTPYDAVTTYNNFYEFGTSKSDPAAESQAFKTRPWMLSFEGEVKKPKQVGIEDLLKLAPMEERIYRMRCVEAWSMVIPWVGYSISHLIRLAEPTANAKFVEFISAEESGSMLGVRSRVLDWPYNEALRMDEAMHPLAMMAFGLYGEVLPNQNGAPMRLVVPWKYGFKGAKSIVKIRFSATMPQTAWMKAGPSEYGFFANVNPQVDHPRWSQASERRIGGGLFTPRIKTLMFNGYAEQVASLYSGMDLRKFY